MPEKLDVRVTVVNIRGLVKNDAPCSPYCRIRLGELLGETLSGSPEGKKDDPVGNYAFNNSMLFSDVDPDDELALEVVNLTDKQVLGRATIPSWYMDVGEKGKRNFSVDLDVMGLVKIRVELPKVSGSSPGEGMPDRIEVLLGPVTGLPAWVMSPQVLGKVGETNFSSGPPKAHVGVGSFEFLESHTLRYSGDREMELTVMDEDERPVGISRFDLHELLSARNPKWQRAGKLAVTNLRGEVVGAISLGIMLWDHSKAGETGGAPIPREQLLAGVESGEKLYSYLKPEMDAGEHVKQERHYEKSRACLDLAKSDIAAAEESQQILTDVTRRFATTTRARQSYNDSARKANHAILSAAANLQVVASSAGTKREATSALIKQKCAQKLEAVQKLLMAEQRALSAKAVLSPRRVTTAAAGSQMPMLATSQPVQEAVQRMASNAADVEQTCGEIRTLCENIRLHTEDPTEILTALNAMDHKIKHLTELQTVITADHDLVANIRQTLAEQRRATVHNAMPEYQALPLKNENHGPLACFPCCMSVPAAT